MWVGRVMALWEHRNWVVRAVLGSVFRFASAVGDFVGTRHRDSYLVL